ncbi:MAG: molybdopterin molybdotransferase MoeA [Anaerolineae bacterium]|nr:molybdopterin molybdotransferase MoeA [Anaerolineae bacterium]
MPEFFNVLPPDEARARWLPRISHRVPDERIHTVDGLGRVTANPVTSPEALPAFRRSTVDGYAARAADTFGASSSLPAYLTLAGEILMGQAPALDINPAEAALIHTGGMLPESADAVVMIENTQSVSEHEIEVLRPVAPGENVIQVGEDIMPGAEILPAGHRIQPQDIGALLALGFSDDLAVRQQPRVSLFSTGDELVTPDTQHLRPGQIRNINSSTIRVLCFQAGADVYDHGIVPDDAEALYAALVETFAASDMLVVTAGSSVSARDITADTINRLGAPGVLVHGIAGRPGKPTILAVVDGKPVMGLPGNPVSAFVMFSLFGIPAIAHMMQAAAPRRVSVQARVTVNVPSVAGREDYIPVRLTERDGERWAEPMFGKSNLIFRLVGASGLLKVPLDQTGLREGAWGEVILF